MGTGTGAPSAEAASAELVSAVYQPVVALPSAEVVGYEAFARGPHGALENPGALLGAARRAGLVEQVDWECRLAAVSGALDAGLSREATLFVNVEPESLGSVSQTEKAPSPERWQEAEEKLSIAIELPASALRSRPAELVRAAAACRARGWTVVLDDVGTDTGSLALLPLVAPDAIKLDLRRGRTEGQPALAEVVTAVWAEQERTGATIVAEGIEYATQLSAAAGIGATLGQGWLWGRPGALPDDCGSCKSSGLRAASRGTDAEGTPFEIVSAAREARETTAPVMASMSRHLELRARSLGAGAIVLGAVGDAGRLSGRVRERFRALAPEAALVGMFGTGMTIDPAVGVHGTDVDPEDPLAREWCVVVLAPHFAAALVGRDLGDEGLSEDARRFTYVVTQDRELVIAAARSLASRIA